MSTEASSEAPALAARATALRLAFAAAIGLAWGAQTEEMIPGFASTFAIQMLAGGGPPPRLGQVAGAVLTVIVTAAFVLLVCNGFADRFPLIVAVLFLLLLLCFLAQEAGGAPGQLSGPALQVCCMLPPFALGPFGVEQEVARQIVIAILRAVLIVWLVHLLFPVPAAARPARATPGAAPAEPKAAFAKTIIILPVILFYALSPETPALTALLGLQTFLVLGGGQAGRAHIGVRVAGNALGGVMAAVAGEVVLWRPSLVGLFLVALLGSLFFAGRITGRAPPAHRPWLAMSFVTFVTLLGLMVSPLGYETQVLWRLFDITMVGLYAVGAAALLMPPPAQPSPRPA